MNINNLNSSVNKNNNSQFQESQKLQNFELTKNKINKFVQAELAVVNNLDIAQNPHEQVELLIEQALKLLYKQHYREYKDKDFKSLTWVEIKKDIDHWKFYQPISFIEGADLVNELYILAQQIHEGITKYMSKHEGLYYQGKNYQQVQAEQQQKQKENQKYYEHRAFANSGWYSDEEGEPWVDQPAIEGDKLHMVSMQRYVISNQLDMILKQATHTTSELKLEILQQKFKLLIHGPFIIQQQQKLHQSFKHLRARWLAAPHQYGDSAVHMEVIPTPTSHYSTDGGDGYR